MPAANGRRKTKTSNRIRYEFSKRACAWFVTKCQQKTMQTHVCTQPIQPNICLDCTHSIRFDSIRFASRVYTHRIHNISINLVVYASSLALLGAYCLQIVRRKVKIKISRVHFIFGIGFAIFFFVINNSIDSSIQSNAFGVPRKCWCRLRM